MRLPTQVYVSHNEPEASKITPVVNERFWKPQGGLWTSTLDNEGGQWVQWLTSEIWHEGEPNWEDKRWGGKLWLLEPEDANLAVVANPSDLMELAASYPHPDIGNLKKIRSFSFLLDWERIAEDYDGLHVPDPWPWRFGYGDNFEYEASMFFYTMDAECTCWSRWCFEGEPRILDPLDSQVPEKGEAA